MFHFKGYSFKLYSQCSLLPKASLAVTVSVSVSANAPKFHAAAPSGNFQATTPTPGRINLFWYKRRLFCKFIKDKLPILGFELANVLRVCPWRVSPHYHSHSHSHSHTHTHAQDPRPSHTHIHPIIGPAPFVGAILSFQSFVDLMWPPIDWQSEFEYEYDQSVFAWSLQGKLAANLELLI